MGAFDILRDRTKECQVKCFHKNMTIYKIGDELPYLGFDAYTIVFPEYEGCRFAIIKNKRLWKLTDSSEEIIEPFIDKWGKQVRVTKKYNPSKRTSMDVLKVRIKLAKWITLSDSDD